MTVTSSASFSGDQAFAAPTLPERQRLVLAQAHPIVNGLLVKTVGSIMNRTGRESVSESEY